MTEVLTRWLGGASLACGCAVLGAPSVASAQCDVFIPGVPDFDQKREADGEIAGLPGDGSMYCVPTSATDWFAYFANHGVPEMLDGPRDWQSNDNYEFVTARIAALGELMGTDAEDGTDGTGTFSGLVQYIVANAPAKFFVTTNFAAGPLFPTVEGLYNAIDGGGYVMMCYGKYQFNDDNPFARGWERKGGHCVALVRIEDGCSSSPRIGWRDPSNGSNKTTQAGFQIKSSDMSEFTDDFLQLGIPLELTRWRFDRWEDSVRLLDSVYIITPTIVLTAEDQFSAIDEMGVNEGLDDDGQEKDPIDPPDDPNDPRLYLLERCGTDPRGCFYAAYEYADDTSTLYEYDPSVELFREIWDFRRKTPVAPGRFGDVYGYDQEQILRIQVATEDGRPRVIGAADAGRDLPDAIAYDDTTDTLTMLLADNAQLASYPADLSDVFVTALPPQVRFSGTPLMRFCPASGRLWLGSTGSRVLFVLERDPNGRWLLVESISLSLDRTVGALHLTDEGTPVVLDNGVLREFEFDNRLLRWLERVGSPFAGMRVGSIISIPRSRTNFDARLHAGPEWSNIVPEREEDEPGAPECPGDLTGPSDPRLPGYGIPNGIVDDNDTLYHREQHTLGNFLVGDVTGSNDPRDPRYGVPDSRLDQSDLAFFRDLVEANRGPCVPEPECPADWDDNGVVNAADVGEFLSDYFADLLNGTLVTDFDGNGVVNPADVGAFLSAYFGSIGPCE